MRRTLAAVVLTLVALPVLAEELEVARDVWLGDSLGTVSRVVAPSPDGRRVACVLEGGVAVREVRTGAWVRWIPCQGATGVAFSPDGARLAISTPRAVLALDATTWKTERAWEREGADAIAFVSTDRLACAQGAQVRIVSVEHTKVTWLGNEDAARVHSLVASPSGEHVAGIDAQGRVLVWETASGRRERALDEQAGSARWWPGTHRLVIVTRLTQAGADDPRFVPWGPWVGGGPLVALDWRTGTRVELPASLREVPVQDATFLPDARLVVLRADRHSRARLAVHDLAAGVVGPTFDVSPGGLADVDRVLAAPDGSWLLGDGDVVWSLDGAPGPIVAHTLAGRADLVAFAPSGALLTAGDAGAAAWDVEPRRPQVGREKRFERETRLRALLVTRAGNPAVLRASSPALLDLVSGAAVTLPFPTSAVVGSCAAAGAGDVLVATPERVVALTVGARADAREVLAPGRITALAASGDLLAVTTRASGRGAQQAAALRLYDLATFAPIDSLPRASEPCVAAVSSDARLVATGQVDGTIVVSDPAGEDLARFEAHAGPVRCLAFTGDGAVLLSIALLEPAVAAWDPRTGRPLGRLSLDGGEATSLATAPTGRRFAVALSPGRVRVVDLR